MDKTAKRSSKSNRRAGGQPKGPAGQPGTPGEDQFPKGTMREPDQMPPKKGDDLQEVKEALQELEEQKGDWSKGG